MKSKKTVKYPEFVGVRMTAKMRGKLKEYAERNETSEGSVVKLALKKFLK
jgi:hypothetical protein